MITNNMTREQIEFVGSNHAGVVRQGPDYWIVRVLGNTLIRVPMEDESVVPGLKMHGYWEAWITSWLTQHAQRGGHFVDIGANVGFFIGRTLGQDRVQRWIPRRFRRHDKRLAEAGVRNIALMRMLPIMPFTALSVLASVSRLRWRDYALGSFLGMLPGSIAYVTLMSFLDW